MPDKPTWCGSLDRIVRELRSLPDPWVDCGTLEKLLGVGRRRAQQILAPCIARRIGVNGVADREAVIAHLGRMASGETVHYERQRRRRFSERLDALYHERRTRVMVEAPAGIVNQKLAGLPEGVSIAPGRIGVTFGSATEALEKLLALAMAIGNDGPLFEQMAMPVSGVSKFPPTGLTPGG